MNPCNGPINAPGLNTAEAKQHLHRVETAAQQQPGVSWMERPEPNPASSGHGRGYYLPGYVAIRLASVVTGLASVVTGFSALVLNFVDDPLLSVL